MFKKHVIASLVALGLLATSISPAFAEDAQTDSTDTDGAAASADAVTTGTTGSTDGAAAGTSTDATVNTTATDKEDEKDDEKDEKDSDLVKKVDLVCMQTAVEKRDNAVIGAMDTFYNNVKTALTARRDAVKAAWGVADRDARKDAIRKAWKDFKGTWKSEKKALKKAKKVAWKQFKADKSTCGGEGEGEGESEGNDIKF